MVVNHQGNSSRESYQRLKSSVKLETIPVYQQEVNHPDVWNLLQGNKDDFLIYDSCGKLTYHLELPYTLLSQPYVEHAIVKTYCQSICTGCSLEHHPQACNARNSTEETKLHRQHHQSRRNHHHNIRKKVNEDLAGDNQNLADNTQLGQGKHEHRQNHHHHSHQHDHQADVEAGIHHSAADNGMQQQNL